ATAGTIRVSVSSPGLRSAEIEIISEKLRPQGASFIVEPPLRDGGRSTVRRDPAYRRPVGASSAQLDLTREKQELLTRTRKAGAFSPNPDTESRSSGSGCAAGPSLQTHRGNVAHTSWNSF